MNYALGELESLARKAAKGAGFSWGEADEAGQAVRILAASNLPAAELFSAYLQALEASKIAAASCPVRLGCQLVDGIEIPSFDCAFPLLIMPFVARLAAAQNCALSLKGEGFEASAGPDLAVIVALTGTWGRDLQLARATTPPNITRVYRAQASDEHIAVFTSLAHRTYAPETEARKQSGAGAGDDGNA